MSRMTISSSASAGLPGMPRRLDHSPSCMWPPVGEGLVLAVLGQGDGPGRPLAYSRARRMRPVVLHAAAVVGEDPHAERRQLAHRRERPRPARPTVMAPLTRTSHSPAVSPSVEHLAHHGGGVDGRLGVGHGQHGGEAAEGGGPAAGLDRLGLLAARLAQVGVEVDEARGDDAAGGVEHRGASRPRAARSRSGPPRRSCRRRRRPRRPPARRSGRSPGRLGSPVPVPRLPSSSVLRPSSLRSLVPVRSAVAVAALAVARRRPTRCRCRAAGRAPPCARPRRCAPGRRSPSRGRSATSAAISTPRFMGPGCMTSASSAQQVGPAAGEPEAARCTRAARGSAPRSCARAACAAGSTTSMVASTDVEVVAHLAPASRRGSAAAAWAARPG